MTQRRVLVIDDDEAIREIAQASLEAVGGWNVTTACDGTQGYQQAARQRPDAILLDVMMPGLDGPGTVARLQSADDTRQIPVVLLTAKVQASERARFAQLPGVGGVITKPFDPCSWQDRSCTCSDGRTPRPGLVDLDPSPTLNTSMGYGATRTHAEAANSLERGGPCHLS